MELQPPLSESLCQVVEELAAEQFAQGTDWQEEPLAGGNPARAVGRQSAGGSDAMHVRMVLQSLRPGVQDCDEPDFGP